MKMLRIVAAGALSYFAYRAWKRNRDDDAQPYALPDEGARTAPHGDPVLSAEDDDDTAAARASAPVGPGVAAP